MSAPLVVKATAKHTATVIFVHGLGDSGAGWRPVAEMLGKDPALSHVKWVLPNAPVMPVTANGGMGMPSWFDIKEFGLKGRDEDEDGMLKTVSTLNSLITEEVDNGLSASRVVLGGFSQGATMSLLTGLTSERQLGGIVCLSGWIPLREKFASMITDTGKKIPIFWGTGTHDPLVRFDLATMSQQLIQKAGVKTATDEDPVGLTAKVYQGLEHSADSQELSDLHAWIKRVIPEK